MKLENLPEFALGDRWCVKIGMQFEWVGRVSVSWEIFSRKWENVENMADIRMSGWGKNFFEVLGWPSIHTYHTLDRRSAPDGLGGLTV